MPSRRTGLWVLCNFTSKLWLCCTTARSRLLIPGDATPPGPRCRLMTTCIPVAGSFQPTLSRLLPFAVHDTCRYFSFGTRELYSLITKRQFFQYKAWCICQEEQKDGWKGQRNVAAHTLFLKVGSSLRSPPRTDTSMESHIARGTGAFAPLQLFICLLATADSLPLHCSFCRLWSVRLSTTLWSSA